MAVKLVSIYNCLIFPHENNGEDLNMLVLCNLSNLTSVCPESDIISVQKSAFTTRIYPGARDAPFGA